MDWYSFELLALALSALPQLRVLHLGRAHCQPIPAKVLPATLQRLIVVADPVEEEVLVPLAVRHAGLVVEFETLNNPLPSLYEEVFGQVRYSTTGRLG